MNFDSTTFKSLTGFVTFLMLTLSLASGQKEPNFQDDRTTMVHLFEWTWPAIAEECENFLGPQGYGSVQISPPNEVIVTDQYAWWERYQPVSYILTSRSGNESALRDMIERCSSVGVRIYVDVVVNHMSGWKAGETIGTAGSVAFYDDKNYPAVPYGPEDFHYPCGISNYQDEEQVRYCQLSSLLDLDQSKPHVQEMIVNYLNKLLDLGVAGFRVDAAKHMLPEDLKVIYSQLNNLSVEAGFEPGLRPYIYQEVIDLGGERVKKTEYTDFGAVTEFKFSAEIGRLFRGLNQLQWLRNWGPEWDMLPSDDAIVFVDNHDNQRGHGAGGADILTYKNDWNYRLALIFMLAHPYGKVTRVMSSYAFSDSDQGPPTTDGVAISSPILIPNGQCDTESSGWVCEHRWPEVANMAQFRNVVGDSNVSNWWDNQGNQIAFARGDRGFVAINMEDEQSMQVTLQTGLAAGTYCDVISGSRIADGADCTGDKYTVNDEGEVTVDLPKGPIAMAIHVASRLA